MNAATMQHTHTSTETTVAAGGSLLEASGAIATIALSIVGLAGVFPPILAAIAVIVLGASLLSESGVNWAGFGRQSLLRTTEEEASTKLLGGVAGIVLGVLALLGLAPMVLLSVAILVFGATFLLSRQFLMGMGAVVLGILAVVGINSLILVLVGLLSLGTSALLISSVIATRVFTEKTV